MTIIKLQPSRSTIFTFYPSLTKKTTGPTFTKLLHDVQALVPLLMRAYTRQCCIPFAMLEQRVKAVNFDACIKTPKLIGYTAMSLGLQRKLCHLNNPHTHFYQSWKFREINLLLCSVVTKIILSTLVISGVTGSNFT